MTFSGGTPTVGGRRGPRGLPPVRPRTAECSPSARRASRDRWAATALARSGGGRRVRPGRRVGTGRSAPTAGSSPSTRRSGVDGRPCPRRPRRRAWRRPPDGRRLLAGGVRRRDLRLRRRRLLRVHGGHASRRARRRHGRRPPTAVATGWWLRRRDLRLRRRRASTARWGPGTSTRPWSGWRPMPQGGGYWLVASDGGIFAFGDAPVLRLDGRAPAQPAGGRPSWRARAAAGTGSWRPTAASSPSATPPISGSMGAIA